MIARDLGKFISGRTQGCASLTWLYNLEHLGKRSKPRLGVGPRAASTVLATQNRLCSFLSALVFPSYKVGVLRKLRFSFKDAIFGD